MGAPAKTYGQVVHKDGTWGIRAVPHVTVILKRLFIRADHSMPGVLIFRDTPEVARDLEWFTERWPLESDPDTLAYLKRRANEHRVTEEAVFTLLSGYRRPDAWREPARPPREYQLIAADLVHTTGRVLLGDDLGLGKAQPLDTPVLTPTGFRPMGELRIGDYVIAGDGTPTRVVAVFPQGEMDVCRVTFSDGAWVECNDEHLWWVSHRRRIRSRTTGQQLSHYWQAKTLREITDSGLHARCSGQARWHVPMVAAPDMDGGGDRPLDPYLLGVLLGDGGFRGKGVVLTTADDEIVSSVEAAVPPGIAVKPVGKYGYRLVSTEGQANRAVCPCGRAAKTRGLCGRCYQAALASGAPLPPLVGPARHPLIGPLRDLGLWGHTSLEKYVPAAYKVAPVAVRLAVLQGLMDTDGYAMPLRNGNATAQFYSSSRALAEDVRWLAQSLGGTGRITTKFMAHRTRYTVTVKMPRPINPFRLSRKAKVWGDGHKVLPPTRAIRSVEHVGRKPMRCIAVEHPSHLYVTNAFIVTHNTFSAYLVLRKPEALPALVVCKAHLCSQWLRELEISLPWLRGHITAKRDPYDLAGRCGGKQPDVVITSYPKFPYWADYLAGNVATVIYDEIQELRRGVETAKGRAAIQVSAKAAYRVGASVGPSSLVELIGGPFGVGWTGPIEEATNLVAKSVIPARSGAHEIFPVHGMGIRSRGWTGEGFTWKDVKSFIRHPCPAGITIIRSSCGQLTLTDEHSVYQATADRLAIERADAIEVGTRLAGDDGSNWDAGVTETPVDVVALADAALPSAQVTVDLSDITRHDIGVTAWQWQNFQREAKYGSRLPVALYRAHAHLLPPPTWVYVYGKCARRARPQLLLSDWAYMLGFYLGDSWVSGTRVCFAVEKARAESFTEAVRQLPGAETNPTIRPMRGESVEVRFGSPLVAEIIRYTAGDARCYEKKIPGEWIISWPAPARRELLRGLLDSDGHISARHGRRTYTTTSKRLAGSLLSLLRSLGIPGSVTLTEPGPGGRIGDRVIVGRRIRYTVQWSAHAEAGDNQGWRGQRTRFGWTRGKLREIPVRDTVAATDVPAMVYDLEMAGHPSFVADGVLVHNSATPVHNYGGEIWHVMQPLDPEALGTSAEFAREWCGAPRGLAQHTIVKDPAALGEYLRATGLMLRRTRRDLHMELPEPIQIEQPVDTDHEAIDQVAADLVQQAKMLLGEAEATNQDKWHAASEVDWKLRRATGLAKAPYVAAFVKLLLESEQRVVLWGWHRDAYSTWLDELAGYHPLLYTGSETPAQKARNAGAFMGGQCRVLIMSLLSGAGLDGLQKWCSVGVFGELDWSPEQHAQCIGRLNRDGQENTVVAYFMTSDDGTDPHMAEVLGLKRAQSVPIRDPQAGLFEALTPATDRARALAADVLKRIATRKGNLR